MSKIRATAVGLFLAGLMAMAPAGAASRPTGIAAVKAAAPADLAQARWHGGWGGRGWGFPGAFISGPALGTAIGSAGPYYGAPYYGGPYYGYDAAYGGPWYGDHAAYWGGPYWGIHRRVWRRGWWW